MERRWLGWGHRNFRKDITEKIEELFEPDERILDVGCGAGVLYTQLLPEVRRRYVGVDFTPEFIRLCRARYPEGEWRVKDAQSLSFPDDSFYIVNTTNVLQHIKNWRKAAKELFRVSSRYVITTCRIHEQETRIVAMSPVLRRRFNPKDLETFYRQYGDVEWKWTWDSSGGKSLGIFVTKLK